jgi:hypothetical protein
MLDICAEELSCYLECIDISTPWFIPSEIELLSRPPRLPGIPLLPIDPLL